jgi:hypothetical protein
MQRDATPRGTFVERKAWILLAVMATVMILFGLMVYFTDPAQQASTPIQGSKCCNGLVLADNAPPLVIDYVAEIAKYMGTFMVGAGIFALALIVVAYRRRERWAWVSLWYLPALFAIHGFALGSFPFDIVPLALTTLGLVLPARLFWASKSESKAVPATVTA